jgi:hypothetical protein
MTPLHWRWLERILRVKSTDTALVVGVKKKREMSVHLESRDETEALERALARVRAEWGMPSVVALSAFTNGWRRFVLEVESGGYEEDFIDYQHWLAFRDSLQDVIEAVPPKLAVKIRAGIAQWDDRFRLSTVSSPRPLDAEEASRGRWWWERLPRRGGGVLRAHMEEFWSRNDD